MAKLRAFWLNVRGSYWFYPALFSAFAVVAALVTIMVDRNGFNTWLMESGWFVPVNADGARNILNVIAASMIGVAATVFSITIAAVAYASGNYGPRLLSNFMNDRGNQLSLATFIATFVYAVMVLRVVRSPEETTGLSSSASIAAGDSIGFVPQLSLLIATILVGISVAVLVYFLNHVPASIRINQVLKSIGAELLEEIKRRFPADESDREPGRIDFDRDVKSDATGYVQIIDFRQLGKVARASGQRMTLAVRPGDFVHSDITIVHIAAGALDDDAYEKLCVDIRDCFSTGALRSPAQDLEFLIDELVEIALRALSPGINDPFTAITAMHWAGAALAEIAGRGLDRGPEAEEYDAYWLLPMADDFGHFLNRSFGSMRSAVATSPLASINFLTCLAEAAVGASNGERVGTLRAEGEKLMRQARLALSGPDLEDLEAHYGDFSRRMAVLVAQAGQQPVQRNLS